MGGGGCRGREFLSVRRKFVHLIGAEGGAVREGLFGPKGLILVVFP
jgi:hypothetical protein